MSAAPPATPYRLQRDALGRLTLTLADGRVVQGVLPVRAFPLTAPDDGLSLVGPDGREQLWLYHLSTQPEAERALLTQELATREFMPRIARLLAVSTFSTPSRWQVETDRGTTHFVLKGEEDIRRLGDGALLITDDHGGSYRIDKPALLDRRSRRLLERFL